MVWFKNPQERSKDSDETQFNIPNEMYSNYIPEQIFKGVVTLYLQDLRQ